MRINEIIPSALNGIQRVFAYCGNAVSDLFQRIANIVSRVFGNRQPHQAQNRLENEVVELEEDQPVQQVAAGRFIQNHVAEIEEEQPIEQLRDEELNEFKGALKKRMAEDATKSGLDDIAKEAVRIFQKCRDAQVYDLFPLLDRFDFTPAQIRSIHAAITGATQDSPQVERLLELKVPFSDHAERYTLQFVDGKIKVSKAELYTYGDFFQTFLSTEMGSKSRTIVLKVIERERNATLTEHVADFIMIRSDVKTSLMPLEKDTFEAIINFMQGKVELELDDPDTYETIKAISGYFRIKDLEKVYCKSIDQAIIFANDFETQEIDLMKYTGDLTDEQIDQILALPSLRKTGDVIHLKALFPKLSILDESVWKAHVDMSAHGLDVDIAVDQRVAIKNLHDMYRRLKIEGGAGITLLTMPAGLTLNKLLAIAQNPLQGNAIGCKNIWPQIVNQYGDASILNAYTIALTNSVLDKSRNLTWQAQFELVKKEGCEMAGLLDLMALNLLTYISSEESKTRLYGDNPWTYSRAAEKINSCPLAVGGFSPSGLPVGNFSPYDDAHLGAAAQRKF